MEDKVNLKQCQKEDLVGIGLLHGGFLNDIKVIMHTLDGGYQLLLGWSMDWSTGGFWAFAKTPFENS